MIIRKLHKKYDKLTVLKDLSFEVKEGSFVSIIGQSGCGKSTLLNIISGIEHQTSGEITIPQEAKLGYVLQEMVMLPWRTVKENIRLGIEVQTNSVGDIEGNILELIQKFGLSGYENYYPDTISGGMKQRAALIRVLATSPDLILLDEPFSNLDFDVKLKIQREFLNYQKRNNATIIMVTHSIDDAIAISDEVIVLTSKPATVKYRTKVELGLDKKDPILARKSESSSIYFTKLWDELSK